MWNDIETSNDLLNFMVVAETAAQLVRDSSGQPVSIGVSGGWGTGKSSLVKMINHCLKSGDPDNRFIFIEFNAWLYQGYDDARSALLQTVSDTLLKEAQSRQTAIDKAKEFVKRVKWLQIVKLLAPAASGAFLGGTIAGPVGVVIGAVGGVFKTEGTPNAQDIENLRDAYAKLRPELKSLLKDKNQSSLPQEIDALRKAFAELLQELNITLVLLIDDLDRCLPETAISTLEAMRLLLFLENTAFIIAADEQMIRSAVRAHFSDVSLSDDHVTSYFDKLIQIPLRVPKPGNSEIKGYLMLLFAEEAQRKGLINEITYNAAKTTILQSVSKAWAGGLTHKALEDAFGDNVTPMSAYIDLADQLASIMVSSDAINGNPRLIKRFLNNLLIRQAVAKTQNMPVVFDQLVKMQLLERCASAPAYRYLVNSVNPVDGKVSWLTELEDAVRDGNDLPKIDASWDEPFIRNWLSLNPRLGDIDFRPLLYLSRDNTALFANYDEISPEGMQLLEALLKVEDITSPIIDSLKLQGEAECERILNRLISIAREKQWEHLYLIRAFHVPKAYPALGARMVKALDEIPATRRSPVLIPYLRDDVWAAQLLQQWMNDSASPKELIAALRLTKHNTTHNVTGG